MVNLGRKGKIYGAQIVARAFEKAAESYIDPMYPLGTTGAPHEKLSMWINVIGGIAAPMVAQKTRWVDEETAQVFGGHLFSNVVDYANTYMGGTVFPAAGARSAVNRSFQQVAPYYPPQSYSPTYGPSSNAGISDVALKNPIQNGGRYTRS
jgi:hypothetical protein